MTEADEGSRVRLRYTCRLEDDTIYDIADDDILEFVVGEGDVFPELEKAVVGMLPGDVKSVRISAEEVAEFAYQQEAAPVGEHFPAGSEGISGQYNIAPGEEADVSQEFAPAPPMHLERGREEKPNRATQDLIFEIEMLEVEEEAELELGAQDEEKGRAEMETE